MSGIAKRILKGIPGHPGTRPVIFLLALGIFAGGLAGLLVMAAIMVPIFLYGAWSRAPFVAKHEEGAPRA